MIWTDAHLNPPDSCEEPELEHTGCEVCGCERCECELAEMLAYYAEVPLGEPPPLRTIPRPRTLHEPEPLTARELQIGYLLCTDYSLKEIAFLLELSENTVANHKRTVYRKLGVQSRVGVMLLLLGGEAAA